MNHHSLAAVALQPLVPLAWHVDWLLPCFIRYLPLL